jgi:F0F1-type ATP synthase membrane subunit c/vacuolar-type H+-ATPase subunit K
MRMSFRQQLSNVPRSAFLLGLSGLLPFMAGGIGVWLPALGDIRFALPLIILAYGCLIAAFLGGVRWGAAMQNAARQNAARQKMPRYLVMAIMPTLLALVAFMLPLPQAFILLTVLFVAQAVLDVTAVQQGQLADWYAPLRLLLTIIAAAAMTSMLMHALTH